MNQNKTYRPCAGTATLASILPLIFFGAIYFFFAFVGTLTQGLIVLVPALLFGIFIAAILILPTYLSLSYQRYELTPDGLIVSRGVISKSRATIFYNQIQDVEDRQHLMDRVFGLCTLEVKTMTAQNAKLASLSLADAQEIKTALLAKHTRGQTKTVRSQKVSLKEQPGQTPYALHPGRKTIVYGILLLIFSPLLLILFPVGIVITVLLIGAIISNYAASYALTSDYIERKYQFLSQNHLHIPYKKIQDLYTREGLIDRLFGLATLYIETGATEVAVQTNQEKGRVPINNIPCLLRSDALALKEYLLKKLGIKNSVTQSIRETYPLSPLKPFKKTIRATIWLTLLLGISALVAVAIWPNETLVTTTAALLPLLILFIIILTFTYQLAYYRAYYYFENKEILTLRKGIFWRSTLTIPFTNVQHIFVDQDLFDRLFGLYDVHVASAGKTGMEIHIDGLKRAHAEELRDHLMKETKE